MAITGVTLQYVIQVTAQSYTSAINASLLINTSTFFILFLAVFCSIVAYLVYNVALDSMDVSRVALFIYFVPPVDYHISLAGAR